MARAATKAAFVRSLPATMPAKEVIEKAKAAGHKLSAAYVYVIRSKGGSKKNGKAGRAKGKGSSASEKQFMNFVLDIGLGPAQELLDNARAAMQRAVR